GELPRPRGAGGRHEPVSRDAARRRSPPADRAGKEGRGVSQAVRGATPVSARIQPAGTAEFTGPGTVNPRVDQSRSRPTSGPGASDCRPRTTGAGSYSP